MLADDEVFKIDTKGTCFLCLSPGLEHCDEDSEDDLPSTSGYRRILRYLNVANKDLVNGTADSEDSVETEKQDVNVMITMCSSCSSTTTKFNNLFENYEKIKLQLDNCLKSVHQSMKKGDDCPYRVEQFKKKVKPKSIKDSINFCLATNLRRLMFTKCADKLQTSSSKALSNTQKEIKTAVPSSSKTQPQILKVIVTEDENNVTKIQVTKAELASLTPATEDESSGHKPTNVDIDLVSPPTSTSDKISCKFCSKTFSREGLLKFHLAVSHTEHLMFPDLSHFDTIPNVKDALDKVFAQFPKPAKTGSYDCPVLSCWKTFISKTSRKYHIVSHHKMKLIKLLDEQAPEDVRKNNIQKKEKTFSCPHCPLKLTTKTAYTNHRLLSHPDVNIFKHLSPSVQLTKEECKDKTMQVLASMKVQLNNHGHGVVCLYCSARPQSRQTLKQHMISTHANVIAEEIEKLVRKESQEESANVVEHSENFEFQFRCGECDAAFPNQGSLSAHNLEEHMTCKLCGLSFLGGMQALKKHVLMGHTSDAVMPYLDSGCSEERCKVVVKSFFDKIPRVQSQCMFCGQQILWNRGLKQHIVMEHFSEFVEQIKPLVNQYQSRQNEAIEVVDLDDD